MKQKLLIFVLLLAGITVYVLAFQKHQADKLGKKNSRKKVEMQPTTNSQLANTQPDKIKPDPAGNQLVRRAAEQLLHSDPIFAKARFKANLFGVELNGPGQIMLKGGGSGKTRMEFVFSAAGKEQRMIQISDGRYFYFVRQSGDQGTLEYVDLDKIKTLQNDSNRSFNPLMSGNLRALLVHLADNFVFDAPQKLSINGAPVWQVTGVWHRERLARLLRGFNGNRNSAPSLDNIPQHLPHEVRLTFAADSNWSLFPYRIEFNRQDGEKTSQLVSLELFETQKAKDIPDEWFHVNDGVHEPIDRTAFYFERFRTLNLETKTR